MSTCLVYVEQQVDGGPDCCDLSCGWPSDEPSLWEGDQA